MSYYIYLFSPETFESFNKTDKLVAGVRKNQTGIALQLEQGDKLICYVTKISRWIGVLEVTGKSFEDNKPIFSETDDQFTVRFNVTPIAWLNFETAIPIHHDQCWNYLTFTKDYPKNSPRWTPMVRTSLKKIKEADGDFLIQSITKQIELKQIYPLSDVDKAKLKVK